MRIEDRLDEFRTRKAIGLDSVNKTDMPFLIPATIAFIVGMLLKLLIC